jgi:hypothetical protein
MGRGHLWMYCIYVTVSSKLQQTWHSYKLPYASKISDGNENLKNVFLMPFLGPSKHTFLRKFQKLHSLKQLKHL